MSQWRVAIVSGVAASVSAYLVAGAAGVPSTDPLVYRGVLEEGGAPVDGMRAIELRMWNDATATAAANLVCNVIPGNPTPIEAGRFQITLPTECVVGVRTHPSLWIEILVDSVSLGRSSIGAVPYAIEAGRSSYVNPTTGRSVSVGGYCGMTQGTQGAITGGYAGAKMLCEQACSSSTAHVCSPHEVGNTVVTGGTVPAGRMQTLTYAVVGSTTDIDGINDCNGWLTSSIETSAVNWTGNTPQRSTCNTTTPLLCCD